MPHPGGCYVLVYEQARFMGAREYINGPGKYATLADLPFRANWRRRIRSAQVGPAASVTLWEDEQLSGNVAHTGRRCQPPGTGRAERTSRIA